MVLLVSDGHFTAVGAVARHIQANLPPEYPSVIVSPGFLRRSPDILRELASSATLVHYLTPSCHAAVSPLLELAGTVVPNILSVHHVTSPDAMTTRAVLQATRVIVPTDGWRRYVIKSWGRPAENCTVVSYGVDSNKFKGVRHRERSGKFVVGYVGHRGSDADNGRKNIPLLISALTTANNRTDNCLSLHVCGFGWRLMRRRIEQAGVECHWSGYLNDDDMPSYYSNLDALLVTSTVEGGPCTVLEAMACETPVVSTMVGHTSEVVTSGVNGILIPVNDQAGFAAGVVAMVQRTDRRRMGELARQAVVERTWTRTLIPLKTLYRELAGIQTQTLEAATRRLSAIQDASAAFDTLVTTWVNSSSLANLNPVSSVRLFRSLLGFRTSDAITAAKAAFRVPSTTVP